ncbi:hypothetical protein CCACVL1_09078 [Corchorus capsularis]|uniref:TFIIS N-terminal domain-containing protein n=1 Tax=Corchorus capsularis TaxID=210143 RepID=A0A1R3IXQ3_COCAP|nr:hypothetical protein CCACVL1_09078 [Corchorus capsularis]
MTLEDFFTLTEMKDGLTAPSRVEELLTVMKKEKDSVVKNVSDATRQWAAVASTIAATENKDCLDLFIQLDGLWFLDRWLKDAQEFGKDSSDSFVEESITALLRALEKLHRNNEKCISSEICITVKKLLGHNSSRVQDKARLLFDNWKKGRITDDDGGVDSGEKFSDHGISDSATLIGENSRPECSGKDVSVSRGSPQEQNDGVDASKDEPLPSSSLDCGQPESAKASCTETTNNELESRISSDCADVGNRSPNHMASSIGSKPVQENPSMKDELPAKTAEETASLEACSVPDSKQENLEVSGSQKLKELSGDEKQKLGMSVSSSSTVEHALVSSGTGGGSAQEPTKEPNLQNDADANKKGDILNSVTLRDEWKPVAETKKILSGVSVVNHSDNSSQLFKTTGQDGESHSDMLRSSSKNEFKYRKPVDVVTKFSRMDSIGTTDEVKGKSGVEGLRSGSKFTRSPDVIDKRMSDIELDYGIVDALEVARKVAQEVEREVVDGREPSCSSSEKISEGGIRQPSTPDSINGKQDLPTEATPEVSTRPKQSAEAYTEGEGHIINSDVQTNEPENDLHDMESSQVTVAQEPEPNTEKSLCDFDLNQEVCSDDVERAVNSISTPISVVSASRAAAAPGLPAAPLQFEGALGWKGSAATSAFRPASPRRNSDGDKTLSVGGTSSSSKRLDFLDFDLNVAEGGDEKGAELLSGKQVTASSGLHSAESSLEVSPRKSERPKLDLNLISDDGDAPALDLRVEGRLFSNRNGNRSPSPASSSSSMQPFLRNIDLNDRPIHSDASEQGLHHGRPSGNVNAYGGPKPNDPVISIMGTRVEVTRKDFVPQVASLPNGKAPEPATDTSIARTGGLMGLGPTVSYTHSPAFSYNGLTMAPTMSFSSAIYGPSGSIPYMVDSRAPVVPQIMGSTSAVPPPYSQPQFIMSMSNAPVGLNGSGPSRPNFDLNSGLAIDGGNRDSMSLRQTFVPGQGRAMEEHLRANSQPSSSSGVGAKRKEPEGGWESFPFNYRQQQFPWK